MLSRDIEVGQFRLEKGDSSIRDTSYLFQYTYSKVLWIGKQRGPILATLVERDKEEKENKMSHDPKKCHRCEKPFADAATEKAHKKALGEAESGAEATKLRKDFAANFCACPPRLSSEFTSSQQPPNLDDIEKRMK